MNARRYPPHPVVDLVRISRIRAGFMIATLLTCGLASIPWIIWELLERRRPPSYLPLPPLPPPPPPTYYPPRPPAP